jgi:hypothetical protein
MASLRQLVALRAIPDEHVPAQLHAIVCQECAFNSLRVLKDPAGG